MVMARNVRKNSKDQRGRSAAVVLDSDSVRLLEALHRGCFVMVSEMPELSWRVTPRTVVPVMRSGNNEITLVDIHSPDVARCRHAGPAQRVDDWPENEPTVRFTAGILLIRHGLARRRGYALCATAEGRSLAASRIGQGVDTTGEPVLATQVLKCEYVIADDEVPVNVFQPVEPEQILTIFPRKAKWSKETGVEIGVFAGELRVMVSATAPVANAMAELTRSAQDGIQTGLIEIGPGGDLQLSQDPTRLTLTMMQEFNRAAVLLRDNDVAAFGAALKNALNGLTTVLEPVAVACTSFDALSPTKTAH